MIASRIALLLALGAAPASTSTSTVDLTSSAPRRTSSSTAAAVRPPRPVDLNRASLHELTSLPGIGPARAQAIIARRARRPFRRVVELLRIRGIGRKTLRGLRGRVVVGSRSSDRRRTGP